tara:strand:+ start:411 stop:605 length:195 start_codon:yes stop_codon:yes gene_type:complete
MKLYNNLTKDVYGKVKSLKEIKENICMYESTSIYDVTDYSEYNYLKTFTLIQLLNLFPYWNVKN